MRREQRRDKQRRYRKKQHDYTAGLKKDTEHLREEISELEQKQRSLNVKVPCVDGGSGVLPTFSPRLSTDGPTRPHDGGTRGFVRSVMAPNVVFNTGRGEGA